MLINWSMFENMTASRRLYYVEAGHSNTSHSKRVHIFNLAILGKFVDLSQSTIVGIDWELRQQFSLRNHSGNFKVFFLELNIHEGKKYKKFFFSKCWCLFLFLNCLVDTRTGFPLSKGD